MKTAGFLALSLVLAACHAKKLPATPSKEVIPAPEKPTPDQPACQTVDGFIDADGDGYGSATSYCAGSPPANVVTSVLGADCDDTQPLAWSACATCKDNDGDGVFGVCDKTPATGVDADDDNPMVSTPGALATCADLDGDGYFAGCDAYPGSAADCDDTRDWIHPGAQNLPTGDLTEDVDCDPDTTFTINDSNAIFVDATNGSDVAGDGSAAKPFQSIGQANGVVDQRTIVAAVGTYVEIVDLLHPLVGSFHNTDGQWMRTGFSPSAAPTAAQWTLIEGTVLLGGDVSLVAGIAVDDENPLPVHPDRCYALSQTSGVVTLLENNVAVDCAFAGDQTAPYQIGIYLPDVAHAIRQTVTVSNTNTATVESSTAISFSNGGDSREGHYSVTGTSHSGIAMYSTTAGDISSTSDTISVSLSGSQFAFGVSNDSSFATLRGDSISASGGDDSFGIFALYEPLASDPTRVMGFGVSQSAVVASGNHSDAITVGADLASGTSAYVRLHVSDSVLQSDGTLAAVTIDSIGDHADVAFINSILDQTGSGQGIILTESSQPTVLINDIVIAPTFLYSSAGTQFSLDNNLFFGGTTAIVNGSTTADLNDCSTFSTLCAHTANNIFGDPLFTHADTTLLPAFADFHVSASSPARAAGIDPSTLRTLTAPEKLNFDNHPRAVWNIGPD